MALAKTPSAARQAAPALAPPVPRPAWQRVFRAVGAAGAGWLKRRARRAELRRLLRAGPHLIADIGLSPEAARREACKPFWKD